MVCPHQKEKETLYACKKHLSGEALQDAFILTYDRMRRYEGAWHLERRALFPGYVFLESRDGNRLRQELEKFLGARQTLGNGGQLIFVDSEEEHFLRNLCGSEHHSGMSRGYIHNGQTFVTEGPLRGKEYLIRKIDRHKRTAKIRMPVGDREFEGWNQMGDGQQKEQIAGRFREAQVGLEIVAKD